MDLLLSQSAKKLKACKWTSQETFEIGKDHYKKMFMMGSNIDVFGLENAGEFIYYGGAILCSNDVIVHKKDKRAPLLKEIHEMEKECVDQLPRILKSDYSSTLVRILSGVKAKRISKQQSKKPASKTPSIVSSSESEEEDDEEEEEEIEEE